jgi:hypothetical protein
LLPGFISKPSPLSKTRGGKLIANDVLVLVKKLGVVDAKVERRIVIQ